MKKALSMIAAGALLLSTASVAFAWGWQQPISTTKQDNSCTLTVVGSVAVSNSGLNLQTGGGKKIMTTGDSLAVSEVLSVANQNGIGSGSGNINQGNSKTNTFVLSGAVSNSGLNKQDGWGHPSVKVMHTGSAGSSSSVASWANINLSGMSIN